MNDRFGKYIRSCRELRGQTPEILAERSGLSTDTINRLEAGAISPGLDTLRKLAMGFELQLSALFEGFDAREREARRELLAAIDSLTDEQRLALQVFLQTLRGSG